MSRPDVDPATDAASAAVKDTTTDRGEPGDGDDSPGGNSSGHRGEPSPGRAAPVRIGPAQRGAAERWLRANGLPAGIRGNARPGSVIRRPLAFLACAAVIVAVMIDVALVTDLSSVSGAAFLGGTLVVAVVGAYVLTALGIPELSVFAIRWFARKLWTSGAGIHVLPLLLVAVTFFFLTGETWMSIGRLSGLPLVLTMLLVGALALAALFRGGGVDWHEHRVEPNASWFRSRVPRHLLPGGPIRYADPAPRVAERLNLRLLSVLGRLLVAVVVGLFILVFFVIFGVLTVDAAVVDNWSGQPADIWWQATVANHTYLLSAEHFRVASFLGAFAALYFIVSSRADKDLGAVLTDDTTAHLERVLAVRALYLAQEQPSAAQIAVEDDPPELGPGAGPGRS